MIACNLHHAEQRSDSGSGQITAAIGQDKTGDRRRYVGKRDKLPDMSGADQNDEIA